MENGTCILVRNRWQWRRPFSSLLYVLIRWLHGSPFNHAALVWNDGHHLRVVEAWAQGLTTPAGGWPTLEAWLSRRPRWVQLIPPPHPVHPLAVVGVIIAAPRYGYEELLSHAWYSVTGHWWGKPRTSRVLTCGELVATVWGLEQAHAYSPGRLWREFGVVETP